MLRLALFALVLFAQLSSTSAQTTETAVDFAAVDRFMHDQLETQLVPGAALVITEGDEVVHIGSYGEARPGEAVSPQTQFFIGSISKSFTALAVMQLVERGLITLDTPVAQLVQEFAPADPRTSQVTVRHLLNMNSGLSDRGFPMPVTEPGISLSEYVALLRDAQFVSEPGTRFHYFNANYGVLSRLIEVVSGQPFEEYMRDQVFVPLGMSSTLEVRHTGAVPTLPNLAQGHSIFFIRPIPLRENLGFILGAGGIVSTAEDMGRYLVAQINGGRLGDTQIISPQSVTLMQTAQGDMSAQYGFGWFDRANQSPRLIEHSGSLTTYASDMVLLPEHDTAFVILMNQQHFLSSYTAYPQIKQGLVALLSGDQPIGGISARMVGVVLLVIAIINLVFEVRGLFQLPKWAQSSAGKRFPQIVSSLISDAASILILVFLPTLSGVLLDRVPNFETLLTSMPDVIMWLVLGAVLSALKIIIKLVLWSRQRAESQPLQASG
jgi:CubicO group peptidase (beta-lactamase class C family)